ncbi:MAG: phytanoyl-CoA dioxygenase family protein [Phenylobacterium sp.]|uniref:phytanoyl-CoA dioxygenase family protein n=1 Tax=Phenylobacterium sp. TaxID=1871053 RepID=UPI0027365826|nr:phytanoyl-CoA dioxygenase family protein [Phenylobacterium sp.]MDP3745730.1 phytanoyl-CoA dioxygenase family protein [Phenylobacterium sp.]
MDRDAQQTAWRDDGFFVLRGLVSPDEAKACEDEVIDRIRADPPERHAGEIAYMSGPNYLIYPETEPSRGAANPEDRVSKVFNCHVEGAARAIAERQAIVDVVESLLGPDLDCFQSQFIFKNPGVIGQPWHQDSYYFRFDRQPQIGVWVALSRATLENGCLWVLPGSHKGEIHEHVPDRRPAANRGYLEIVGEDTSPRIPSLMEPGDVLFFHSYLMHMSTDNVADERRAAMVYHYGRAGTQAETPAAAAQLSRVNRWLPVRRRAA